MPIYEYRCEACGERSSHFYRTVSEAQESRPLCPKCGSRRVRRLISRVAVHGGQRQGEQEVDSTEPEKPPVFGRKELEAIMEQRRQWAEEVAEEG